MNVRHWLLVVVMTMTVMTMTVMTMAVITMAVTTIKAIADVMEGPI